jgi:hypothetical protein
LTVIIAALLPSCWSRPANRRDNHFGRFKPKKDRTMLVQLFDFLRASGISFADLANFIDKDWEIPASRSAELISLIEAREPSFREGVRRVHSELFACGSVEELFWALKWKGDRFIKELRWSIEYDSALWVGLAIMDRDGQALDLIEAYEMLDGTDCRLPTPTSVQVIASPTIPPETEIIDAEEGLAACNRLSETLIQVGADDS